MLISLLPWSCPLRSPLLWPGTLYNGLAAESKHLQAGPLGRRRGREEGWGSLAHPGKGRALWRPGANAIKMWRSAQQCRWRCASYDFFFSLKKMTERCMGCHTLLQMEHEAASRGRAFIALCTVPSVYFFCVEQCQYTYKNTNIHMYPLQTHTTNDNSRHMRSFSSKLFSTVAIRLLLLVIWHGLHWSDPWYKKTCLVCVQGEGLAVIDNLIWYR